LFHEVATHALVPGVHALALVGELSRFTRWGRPADLAGYVREHWSIESLHWIRDTLYQKDK
jgi:hypothetical protein